MTHGALAVAATSPVKNEIYESTLKSMKALGRAETHRFLSQWFAFSAVMPELLSICAIKATTESERANIITNLHSELGLDGDGISHPQLLKDLILKVTGVEPSGADITGETRAFIEGLRTALLMGSAAANAGILQALEAVAYDILDVLKEIVTKSGNADLAAHPYIVIHEELEAMHIENTDENVKMHGAARVASEAGYAQMMRAWEAFWAAAYRDLVGQP
jgi:hypothetical protein